MRPCKYTQEEFTKAYDQAISTAHLARILNITTASVYDYLKRYELPVPSDPEQESRDKIFRKAYKKATSITEMTELLGVSTSTIKRYLKRLSLQAPSVKGKKPAHKSRQIMDDYHGLITVDDLMKKYNLTKTPIIHHLETAIHNRWKSPRQQRFPRPESVSEIKIVHELERDESLIGDPVQIMQLTNVQEMRVERYLKRAYRKWRRD